MSYDWWDAFLAVIQRGHVWKKIKQIPETIRESENLELYYQCAYQLRDTLTVLQILGTRFTTIRPADISQLEEYPNLKILNVFPRYGFSTIQDYELLFVYADQITELIIDWHDLGYSPNELSALEDRQSRAPTRPQTTYTKLKKLTIGGCFSHPTLYTLQVRYFLQKFPTLEEIELTYQGLYPIDELCYQSLIQIPSLIIKIRYVELLLQLLRSFIQDTNRRRFRAEYLPEYRFMRQVTVQIHLGPEGIDCLIHGEYENDFSNSTVSEVLNLLGFRIFRLSIEHPGHFWEGFNLALYGDYCRQIRFLEIYFISVSRYLPDQARKHPSLSEIRLRRATVHELVFSDMSLALPSLHTLRLNNCTFPTMEGAPMHLQLNMPYTCFHWLEIDLDSYADQELLVRLSKTQSCCTEYYILEKQKGLARVPLFVVNELHANFYPHYTTLSILCRSIAHLVLISQERFRLSF
ncbi:hypothetical protein BY458DRAFT_437593 [Sporodiniella umbellata]|nr:hypothetical protein BY458DRAFT_437593 [Sporodiniella umbellata]